LGNGKRRVERRFFQRASHLVASDLIGMTLISHRGPECGGRIVETEAYGDRSDLASHSAVYTKSRAHLLAAEPGTLYVYLSYGVHQCLNFVAHEPGGAGAVLIRALEPTIGLDTLRERRGVVNDKLLLAGPGRVAQGLAVSREDTGADLIGGAVLELVDTGQRPKVVATPRIGITRDMERPWRFIAADSPFVSRARVSSSASI
jgi:DNA-3-methyladenine glycosylase